MQQVLRLEHAFAEYERLGAKLNEDLKTAILMRCVTGQLKVWLQLQVNESTNYAKVREMVLLYDSSTTKWTEQMVLGSDNTMSSTDGPVPMEIDRVESKGKNKGAKGKSKSSPKGKSKGKGKTKDGKGKGKSFDQKGSKGNVNAQNDRSKGKGKGDSKACMFCLRATRAFSKRLLAFTACETGWFWHDAGYNNNCTGITILIFGWNVKRFSPTASDAVASNSV